MNFVNCYKTLVSLQTIQKSVSFAEWAIQKHQVSFSAIQVISSFSAAILFKDWVFIHHSISKKIKTKQIFIRLQTYFSLENINSTFFIENLDSVKFLKQQKKNYRFQVGSYMLKNGVYTYSILLSFPVNGFTHLGTILMAKKEYFCKDTVLAFFHHCCQVICTFSTQ